MLFLFQIFFILAIFYNNFFYIFRNETLKFFVEILILVKYFNLVAKLKRSETKLTIVVWPVLIYLATRVCVSSVHCGRLASTQISRKTKNKVSSLGMTWTLEVEWESARFEIGKVRVDRLKHINTFGSNFGLQWSCMHL